MARFLIDEDMHRSLAGILKTLGHEALDARDVGLRGRPDSEVFKFAQAHGAIIFAADLDFADITVHPPGVFQRRRVFLSASSQAPSPIQRLGILVQKRQYVPMQPQNTIDYLTQDELKRLFGVIEDKRDKAMFRLAYTYGLRSRELALLERSHVDFDRMRLYIPRVKGSLSGEYPLRPEVARLLKSYLKARADNNPALFTSNRGFPVATRTLRWLMKKYGAKAKLPEAKRHFHTLKHSIGTHMIDAGAEVLLVKDWLGHKNIQNTLIYAQLIGKTRDELASRVFASRKVV